MKLAIATSALDAIVAHAAAAGPVEACGVVLGTERSIASAVPAANVAAEPSTSFEIDPAALLGAHRSARETGQAVVGWYHSHPNGSPAPSTIDAARADEDGKVWLIAAAGSVSAWRATRGGSVHGRFDPVDLVAA